MHRLNVNHPEHVYLCSFVQFLKPLRKQDPKDAENKTCTVASSHMLFSKQQTVGNKVNLFRTPWQWRHSSTKMLFYSDSAADKEIIHLSDAMNMEQKKLFPEKIQCRKSIYNINVFWKKMFYNLVKMLKAEQKCSCLSHSCVQNASLPQTASELAPVMVTWTQATRLTRVGRT